jgi:hypothetical protein
MLTTTYHLGFIILRTLALVLINYFFCKLFTILCTAIYAYYDHAVNKPSH